jgi:hypothetical protein
MKRRVLEALDTLRHNLEMGDATGLEPVTAFPSTGRSHPPGNADTIETVTPILPSNDHV